MFRVLIADDEKMVLVSTENSFAFAKYNMRAAEKTCDSFEALQLLQSSRFDAAFLDIRMPGLSGIDIIRSCRNENINTEFIVVSGYSDYSYMKDAIQLGAFDYCLKPVQSKETDVILERLFEKLYKNRLGQDPDLLIKLFSIKDIRPSLEYLRISPKENNLTVFAVDAPCVKDILSVNPFPEDYAGFILSETRALFIYAIPPSDISTVTQSYLAVSGCRLAVGNTAVNSGQFLKLIEQLTIDLLLTSEAEPLINTVIGNSDDVFLQLLDEVRSQFTEEISLQKLAEKYNLSYSYCSELFKSVTGFNFSKYIAKLRMTTASELLLTTSNSVSQISYSVGYQNYHHFVGMFKTYFGVTPTEYRQKRTKT